MLWMKYWHETRLRFLFAIGLFAAITAMNYVAASRAPANASPIPAPQRLAVTLNIFAIFWVMPAVMQAAAGIKTQAPFQAMKGIHGSVHFTLSLPVSRLRLFSTRVAIGILEFAGIVAAGTFGLWLVLSVQYPQLTFYPADAFRHAFTVFAITTCFYFVSVLLATVLEDDMSQMWGSFVIIALLGLATSYLFDVPEYLDILRAIGRNSPLATHAMSWGPIAVSLGLSAILCLAAARFIQSRDY